MQATMQRLPCQGRPAGARAIDPGSLAQKTDGHVGITEPPCQNAADLPLGNLSNDTQVSLRHTLLTTPSINRSAHLERDVSGDSQPFYISFHAHNLL